jgi:hypothetical protein
MNDTALKRLANMMEVLDAGTVQKKDFEEILKSVMIHVII